jgi:hypothetical protein
MTSSKGRAMDGFTGRKKDGMNISAHAGRPVTQLVSAPWWPAEKLSEGDSLV